MPLPILALAGLAQAGVGIFGASSQGRRAKKREAAALKALEEYDRQALTNVYAGLTVPKEPFELRTEAVQQAQATAVGALAGAGARGLVGGLGGVQQRTQQGIAQIAAEMEQAQFRLQQMQAEDQARVRAMQEQREQQDIAGLGRELGLARQQRASATESLYSSIGAGLGHGLGAAAGLGAFGEETQSAYNMSQTQLPQ
jgi:hypothetical protein